MRVSAIELLGKKYPLCFSLTAATEMEDAFGGLDKLSERVAGGSMAQRARAVNTALAIWLISEPLAAVRSFAPHLAIW